MLTGPLCQGPWVNTAADWDVQRSLAVEKDMKVVQEAFLPAQSSRCLPKSYVVYASMWPSCVSAKFSNIGRA